MGAGAVAGCTGVAVGSWTLPARAVVTDDIEEESDEPQESQD